MEAAFLLTAMVAVALVFGFFGLDIGVARAFYSADGPDHWPLAKELPWRVLYDSAPWFTAGLVVAGLVALAASVRRPWRSWRRCRCSCTS